MSNVRTKHNHYHKPVEGLQFVDVYRVLLLFAVTDPCLQHAIKKLLVAGGRGAGKSIDKDIQEAIDSLVRWQEMRAEEVPKAPQGPKAAIDPPCSFCDYFVEDKNTRHGARCNREQIYSDFSCFMPRGVFAITPVEQARKIADEACTGPGVRK